MSPLHTIKQSKNNVLLGLRSTHQTRELWEIPATTFWIFYEALVALSKLNSKYLKLKHNEVIWLSCVGLPFVIDYTHYRNLWQGTG